MTTRITVSLPDDLVEAARAGVEAGTAASVSAYVAQALEAYRPGPPLQGLLDEIFAATGGAPSEQERHWAREALGLPL